MLQTLESTPWKDRQSSLHFGTPIHPNETLVPFAAKTEGAIAGAESPHPIDTPNTVSNGQRARGERRGTQIGYASIYPVTALSCLKLLLQKPIFPVQNVLITWMALKLPKHEEQPCGSKLCLGHLDT